MDLEDLRPQFRVLKRDRIGLYGSPLSRRDLLVEACVARPADAAAVVCRPNDRLQRDSECPLQAPRRCQRQRVVWDQRVEVFRRQQERCGKREGLMLELGLSVGREPAMKHGMAELVSKAQTNAVSRCLSRVDEEPQSSITVCRHEGRGRIAGPEIDAKHNARGGLDDCRDVVDTSRRQAPIATQVCCRDLRLVRVVVPWLGELLGRIDIDSGVQEALGDEHRGVESRLNRGETPN